MWGCLPNFDSMTEQRRRRCSIIESGVHRVSKMMLHSALPGIDFRDGSTFGLHFNQLQFPILEEAALGVDRYILIGIHDVVMRRRLFDI